MNASIPNNFSKQIYSMNVLALEQIFLHCEYKYKFKCL